MNEQPTPPPSLWTLADLATPMAVRVAATLGVADHLAAGATSAEELARRTGTHADALARVLRHLADRGVLRRTAEDAYALTDLGQQLRSDHPTGVRAWLDANGAVGRADLCMIELGHTVRTAEPAYPRHFDGATFWGDLATHPELSASFDALMGHHAAADVIPAVTAAYDWDQAAYVLDVGGGDGTLLIALLTAHPALRGAVVELPGPAEAARVKLAEAGLGERVTAMPGSFFDPLPTGADVCVLSAVVHGWDDEEARAIVRRCAEAVRPDGRVLIAEYLADESEGGTGGGAAANAAGGTGEDSTRVSTDMDLRMLTYGTGRERNLAELVALGTTAGLTFVGRRVTGGMTVVEFARPT